MSAPPEQAAGEVLPGFVWVSSAQRIVRGVQSRDWVEVGLGQVGLALDTISLRLDPVGTFLAWAITEGLEWLVERVQPLQDMLNLVAGDPKRVGHLGDTWDTLAAELDRQAARVEAGGGRLRRDWPDDSGDRAHDHVLDHWLLLQASATAAKGMAAVSRGANGVIVAVRSMVLEVIGQFLAALAVQVPSWFATAGVSMGMATPVVAARVTAAVTQCMKKIVNVFKLLVSSLINLRGYIDELLKIFVGIRKAVPKAGDVTPAANPPAVVSVRFGPEVDVAPASLRADIKTDLDELPLQPSNVANAVVDRNQHSDSVDLTSLTPTHDISGKRSTIRVRDLRNSMLDGSFDWNVSPLSVVRDGEITLLVDGHHRREAARLAGLESIPVKDVTVDFLEHGHGSYKTVTDLHTCAAMCVGNGLNPHKLK